MPSVPKRGGGTGKINPQDFASRIKNLASGDLVSEKVDLIWEDGDSFELDNNGMYVLKFETGMECIITVTTSGGGSSFALKTRTPYALLIAVDKVNERAHYICQSTDANVSSGFYFEDPSWAMWKLDISTGGSSDYFSVNGYYIHP